MGWCVLAAGQPVAHAAAFVHPRQVSVPWGAGHPLATTKTMRWSVVTWCVNISCDQDLPLPGHAGPVRGTACRAVRQHRAHRDAQASADPRGEPTGIPQDPAEQEARDPQGRSARPVQHPRCRRSVVHLLPFRRGPSFRGRDRRLPLSPAGEGHAT